MSNFAPYLTINITHDYFHGAIGSPLTNIIPTASTQKWLLQHHMFCRQEVDALTIYCDIDMLQELSVGESAYALQFKIYSEDPYIRNYTRIPFNKPSSIAIFKVGRDENNTFSVKETNWEDYNNINNTGDFETISERDLTNNLVSITSIVESSSQFKKINRELTLSFQSNSAVWQYYIPEYLSENNIEVIDINGKYRCINKGIVKIDNQNYLLFQTNEPISLKSNSAQCFQLRSDHKVLSKRLANADPKQMEWTKSAAGAQPVCHIYIR